MFLQRIEQSGSKTEIALHEFFVILRTVDSGQIEHEIAIPAIGIEFFGRTVQVVLIDGRYGEIAITTGLAGTDIMELGAKILSDKTFGSGN